MKKVMQAIAEGGGEATNEQVMELNNLVDTLTAELEKKKLQAETSDLKVIAVEKDRDTKLAQVAKEFEKL